MIARQVQQDTGMGVSFIVSTVIHLAVFLLLAWWGVNAPPIKIQDTYYVDVVNLPVANPQAGSPAQEASAETVPVAPPLPEAPQTLPAPKNTAKALPAKTAKPGVKGNDKGQETTEEFSDRMAKLARKVEDQQEEATLARMRERVKAQGSGRKGMPAAVGTQSGSDYMAYLQSRLKDAFRSTISYTSKNPEMAVRLFIDVDGKLARRKPERSSGDRAFEIAVYRAIDMASEKFTAPPDHKVFEGVFVFKPQGVSQNKP